MIDEKLNIDDPGNLHGDERTQRQFVIDLAKKIGGYISISDIASALDRTNDEIAGNYARLIRHFGNKDNEFVKVVPEEPFKSAAIYQYVGKDMTDKQIDIEDKKKEELIKFKNAMPYYYAIRKKIPNKGRQTIAWLKLRKDENPTEYSKMLNFTDKYFLDTVPFADNPGRKFKIINKDLFKSIIEKIESGQKVKFESRRRKLVQMIREEVLKMIKDDAILK